MKELIAQLQIKVSEDLYIKDPNSSDLGQSIVKQGLFLIHEGGLENFTFGKLAKALKTTESSIYRYFENKHKLLLYLTSVYWGWLEYNLVFATANISDNEQCLREAIKSLCVITREDMEVQNLSTKQLQNVAILESSKIYLTKEAKQKDEKGLFQGYERLCERISVLIKQLDPDYAFPHSLASTVVESIHHQLFFSRHISSLSDIQEDEGEQLSDFIEQLIFPSLKTAH